MIWQSVGTVNVYHSQHNSRQQTSIFILNIHFFSFHRLPANTLNGRGYLLIWVLFIQAFYFLFILKLI